MSDLVSIIMPSYKTEEYIGESIRSVLGQTYENWELIIVDDCSPDNTDAAVAPFFSDRRIRYLKNEQNSGAAVSRNRALREAKGRWIAFLDSDDLWKPEKLEKQIRFMETNGYSFSYTGYCEIDLQGQETGVHYSGPKQITKHGMFRYCWPGCLTVMYDRDKIGLIQIADIKKNNDYAMWLKACRKADCYLLDEELAMYRRGRTGSISTHSIRTMIGWHYKLFHEAEGMNAVSSGFCTMRNMAFGYYKKMRYRKTDEDNSVKIITRMRGGLGNQLFILAYAYALADQGDKDTEIVLDTREYETFKIRNYELTEVIRDPRVRMFSEKDKSRFYDLTREMFHVAQRLIRKETGSIRILSGMGLYYGRRNVEYCKLKSKKKNYIYGYFQDERIAGALKKRIGKELVLPEVDVPGGKNGRPRIAVSIRIGQDYRDQGWPICEAAYFQKGIQYILKQKYPGQKVDVLVFSDEPEQAKAMNLAENAYFAEGLSPTEQLALMAKCDDFVISNSSFSWWGAYLGAKEDSIVVMPEDWYQWHGKTADTKLVYRNAIIM